MNENSAPTRGGIRGFVSAHRRVVMLVAAGVLATMAWLAFGVFAIQTAFIDKKVNETQPNAAVLRAGSFVSRAHDTAGKAQVFDTSTSPTLSLDSTFTTSNGPDVRVYLVSDTSADQPDESFAKNFVDLGGLKGNIGSQNYVIPASVDLTKYRTVVLWCKRFSVSFGAADLAPSR